MDLFIKSVNLFKWQFSIFEDDQSIAFIDLKALKEGADLTIKGEPFRVYREHLFSGSFILEAFGKEIARAEKPSAFKRRFAVTFAGRRFVVEAEGVFKRGFVITEEPKEGIGVEIGRVEPTKWYKLDATARFDDDLPLAVDVFMLVLVFLQWKRAAESSG